MQGGLLKLPHMVTEGLKKTVSTVIQNKPIASVHLTYQQRCSQQTTCQLRLCTA